MKKNEERLKGSKSSPAEQKAYRDKVKEMRNAIDLKKNESNSDASLSDQCAGKVVEPDIANCTNIPLYDIKLFQEAQAVAAEKIVSKTSIFLVVKFYDFKFSKMLFGMLVKLKKLKG